MPEPTPSQSEREMEYAESMGVGPTAEAYLERHLSQCPDEGEEEARHEFALSLASLSNEAFHEAMAQYDAENRRRKSITSTERMVQ